MRKPLGRKRAIKICAERIRSMTAGNSAYLVEPILDFDIPVETDRAITLITWGVFNPSRPTMSRMYLVPEPDRPRYLLAVKVADPRGRATAVFGSIPAGVPRNPSDLSGTLEVLFGRNGAHRFPLIRELPTFVIHRDNSLASHSSSGVLSAGDVKELFWATIQKIPVPDIRGVCRGLRAFRGDPMSRTDVEFAEAFGRQRHRSALSPWMLGERMSRGDFEKWFSLISDVEHVYSEVDVMRTTWKGMFSSQDRATRPSGKLRFLEMKGFRRLRFAGKAP